ncbi:hypothetical protein FRB94_004821 [Tulasnella sp. JGI-2019a]|nr:hypothetical protein FRB94_004821 [Tulasnella sp. JGI-2019a]
MKLKRTLRQVLGVRPKNQSPGASSKIRSRSNAARPEPVFVTQGDRQRTFVNPPTIYFYEKSMPYYSFTNFSPHPVRLQGKKYPTSEHLFQAMKFLGHKPQIAEHIRTVGKNPRLAFNEARRFSSEVRKDWREVNVAVVGRSWYTSLRHHETDNMEMPIRWMRLFDSSLNSIPP